jgi:3-deoxy-D-manno-octulosonic-acid transferase
VTRPAVTRSFPLAALRALRRGGLVPAAVAQPPRPPGPLVWAHVDDAARIGPLVALADRMVTDGDSFHLLVTAPDLPASTHPGLRATLLPAPADQALAVAAFLDHWQPDLMVWSGGRFRPLLLSAAMERTGLQTRILIDAAAPSLTAEGLAWLPGAARALAAGFDHALARDAAAAQRLRRLGLLPDRVEVTGMLDTLPPVLSCNERERRDLAQTLGARPVWLAAGFVAHELPALATAQRAAIRSAHRLLLIAVPRLTDDLATAATAFRDEGLTLAQRADGAEPDESAQVYLADSMAELGLWYRLAPVTFAGSTLPGSGGGSRPPFEVAALGSAIIHGPETQPHAATYQRLARAGAARIVRGGTDLGQTVEALLAPDRAAAMAHAAWEVTTEGVDVANRLTDLLRAALERVDR